MNGAPPPTTDPTQPPNNVPHVSDGRAYGRSENIYAVGFTDYMAFYRYFMLKTQAAFILPSTAVYWHQLH